MKTAVARVLAVSFGLGLAGVAAVAATVVPVRPVTALLLLAKEQLLPGVETRLMEQGPPRNAAVRAEIARRANPPWAGVYRTARGWPIELAIAPDAGFTLHDDSWCGNCNRYTSIGKVVAAEGTSLKLEVELQEPDDAPDRYELDDTLHLVPWGEWVFAVPRSRMETFCAEFSDGSTFPGEPFRNAYGRNVSGTTQPPRPPGKPRVPSEFERLILDEPITGRVIALVDWRRRPELDGEKRCAHDAVLSIGVGSDEGLAPGMRLFIEGDWGRGQFSGRVERVERHAARFQLLAYDDERAWARAWRERP